ncbi:OsmC family protein [Sporolactobacillus pectinivorans]|uniref:OsmC family protein n=1 Tax=Sporolactobacillus pectinivorans TaxID=1591408 RepID=UPI000C260AD9|nr:OsmC family protein [Sporolactobacillus pectinivorans]
MTLRADDQGFTLTSEHGTMKINKADDFRPGDLLETSIGACSGLVFKRLLTNRGINYSDLSIETDKVQAKEEPEPIKKVDVHVTLKGSNLDEKLIRRLFNHVYTNCTIAQSVKGAIEVEETLEIVQTQEALQ